MSTSGKKRPADEETLRSPTTCMACRAAKVKCDKRSPCGRCVRLGIECVQPPPSLRGKIQRYSRSDSRGVDIIVASVVTRAGVWSKDHVGLMWLLRKWVAIALRRRSIKLLAKATALAVKLGVSMDELLGGGCSASAAAAGSPVASFSYAPLLEVQRDQQTVQGPPLRWEDIPVELRRSTPCDAAKCSWLHCIEWKHGVRRDYLNAEIQRNLITHTTLARVYSQNEVECWEKIMDAATHKKFLSRFGELVAGYRTHDQEQPAISNVASAVLILSKGGTVSASIDISFIISRSLDAHLFLAFNPKFEVEQASRDAAGRAEPALAGEGRGKAPTSLPAFDGFTIFPTESKHDEAYWENPDELDAAILSCLK